MKIKLLVISAIVALTTGCQSLYMNDFDISKENFEKNYEIGEFEVQSSRVSDNSVHHYTLINKDVRFPCRPKNCTLNSEVILSHDEIDTVELEALVVKNRADWKIDYNTNVNSKNGMLNVTFSDVFVHVVFTDTKTNKEIKLARTVVTGKDLIDIKLFFEHEANRIKKAY